MKKSLLMSSIATEVIGDYVVVVHSSDSPSDAEWQKNIALQTSVPPNRARVLVWTDGGSPNAKQRGALRVALQGAQPLTAVLTPSGIAQTIGIAISWFNPSMRIFLLNNLEEALDHLKIVGPDRQLLKDTLGRLRRSLWRLPTASGGAF